MFSKKPIGALALGVALATTTPGWASFGPMSAPVSAALLQSQAPRQALAAAPATPAEPAAPRYRIHSGDSLEIRVIGRPELTQLVTVAPDGTIVYPYVGELNLQGQTITQVIGQMQGLLKKQMVNPQVLVSIVKRQMGQVSVIGPVKEPGKHELGDDWRVLQLIAASGGLTVERPEFVTLRIVRKGGTQTLPIDPIPLFGTGDPQANVLLEDGDLLVIQERDRSETMVNVLGEVARPGQLACPRDGSPLALLAAAGGGTARSALSRAVIRRGASGSPIAVDLSSPEKLGPSLQIGPGDTLIIPANTSQVMVSGAVAKPGPVDLPEKGTPTLFWAIQQAGGALSDADLKKASLVRLSPSGAPVRTPLDLEKLLKNQNNKEKALAEAAKLNLPLQTGDVIDIPTKGRRSSGFRLGLNELMMGLSTYTMVHQLK